MRKREERLIVTFRTTTEAMAAERACREDKISGRLIPVPRQITSGCGLAWSAPSDQRGILTEYLEAEGLAFEAAGIYWI